MMETKKKRLSREEKHKLFVIDVINKMFEIAGHEVTYDDVVGREDNWYQEWTMTYEQSEEWRNWGVSEMKKRFRYNQKWAESEMAMINLMWGLKYSNYPK